MILLTLLGEQPIPNLLPLWQYEHFTAVRFVATERTRELAENLKGFIESDPQLKNRQVYPALLVPAYDLPAARSSLGQAISETARQGEELTINLTGGTKLMSPAAMQAAYGQAVPLLYVNSENGCMIFYSSDGVETRREGIRVQISVAQYLGAHGVEVSDNPNFDPFGADFRPPKEGDELEQSIFTAARDSGYFDDVRRNMFIRRRGRSEPVKNELDICVTRNGSLAVCSCKSGKVNQDDLYELEALSMREKFGIYCGRVFASAMDVLPESFIERTAADRIKLAYGPDVTQRAVEQLNNAVTPRDKQIS